MQNATFDSFVNIGLGTLTPSKDTTFESFENLGVGVLPISKDATYEVFENLGFAPVWQTIVRLPRGWGLAVQSSTVVIVGDPDATTDNMMNVT